MGRTREERREYAMKFWNYIQQLETKPQTKTELRNLHNNEFRASLQRFDVRCSFSAAMWVLKGQHKISQRKNSDEIHYGGKKIAVDQGFVERRTIEKLKSMTEESDEDVQVESIPVVIRKVSRVGELVRGLLRNRDHYVSDKQGIRVYSDCDEPNGVINFTGLGNRPEQSCDLDITILNTSEKEIKLQHCEKLQPMGCFALYDKHRISLGSQKVAVLPGQKKYKISVSFSSKNIGIFKVPIVFEFLSPSSEIFHIVRFLEQNVTTEDVESLKPTAPYKPPKPVSTLRDPQVVIDPGEPPELSIPKNLKVPLQKYNIPGSLRHQINQGPEHYSDDLKKILQMNDNKVMNPGKRLATLLFIEEMQMEYDIVRYNMEGVTMKKDGQYLVLEVPGLAENRPSVQRGDHLFVQVCGDKTMEYQGYVHFVELNQVKLKFGTKFKNKFLNGMKFNVRFTFTRTPLRLMHRSLELGKKLLDEGKFPSLLMFVGDHLDELRDPTQELRLFDEKLERNEQQYDAVRNIVAGTSRPAPYIIFGPPGTGKTVTLVEALKQVLSCLKDSKVLACAPSNSAADLILQRLLVHNVVPKKQILRLNAFGRDKKAVPHDVLECSCTENDNFTFPDKDKIMSDYRVVVSTLVTAGRLVSAGVDLQHFTHVFIDESGQAIEPETLVAIVGLFSTETPQGGQLVLAGDPKQLGPILRSPVAIKHGLGISMIERLMNDASFYQKIVDSPGETPEYDQNVITKLLKNYRSHPSILEVPNEMFYDNELEVCADELARNSFCQLDILPKRGFPVIFDGVIGKDQREERSPSFFNPQEAATVLKYVKDIKNARGGMRIQMKDIGIISPYHRQVQKIRQLLKKANITDIKVGSVEEFQGQERTVIIISTVRSTQEYLNIDAEFKLGFLRNPKRFNVAITRAKALLIVVGNPHVLCADPCWRRFIQFCKSKGGYRGCDFTMPEEEEEEITDLFAKLNLSTPDDALTVDNDNQAAVNSVAVEGLAWRNFHQ